MPRCPRVTMSRCHDRDAPPNLPQAEMAHSVRSPSMPPVHRRHETYSKQIMSCQKARKTHFWSNLTGLTGLVTPACLIAQVYHKSRDKTASCGLRKACPGPARSVQQISNVHHSLVWHWLLPCRSARASGSTAPTICQPWSARCHPSSEPWVVTRKQALWSHKEDVAAVVLPKKELEITPWYSPWFTMILLESTSRT